MVRGWEGGKEGGCPIYRYNFFNTLKKILRKTPRGGEREREREREGERMRDRQIDRYIYIYIYIEREREREKQNFWG